ncbi:MAG: exodeoxyribonuclease V subunit beta, partial [Desulfobulbaceae bacterium]|nr:exodeoxyribonuclease V subunit beta [Desulfobulbaceae bacterium]
PRTTPLAGVNLIEASAGTGKTYTITSLYLRLLLERQLLPEQILVVTFTEAATKELADRIRARLRDCLGVFEGEASEDPFLVHLAGKFRGNELAHAALVNAIRSMDLAAIYTIHGFCRRVLEECAFESGTLFETEFLHNDADLLQQVIDDYWRTRSPEWSPLLIAYLYAMGCHSDSLFVELREPVARAANDGMAALLLPMAAESTAVDGAGLVALMEIWREEREGIVTLLGDKGLSSAKDNYNPANVEAWSTALDRFAADRHAPLPLPALQKFSAGALSQATKKNKATPQHLFFDLAERLLATLEQAHQALRREVIEYAVAELPVRKREQGVLTFDDLLINVRQGLRGPAGAEMAARLCKRFPAALIDEFQDTDPVQFAIFNRIYPRAQNTAMFLIGDPKQAIYSFRGADIFTYLAAAAGTDNRYTLETNYRSEPELIAALNHLFSLHAGARSPFVFPQISYLPVQPGDKEQTFLRMDDGLAPLTLWHFDEASSRDEAKERIARSLAFEIGRLLLAGRTGEAMVGEKPLVAADLAVLVRSHRDGEIVRNALQESNIRAVIYSQDSVFAAKDGWELQLILSAAHDPWDQRRLKSALASSLLGWDAAGLIRLEEDEQLWEEIIDRFTTYQRLWREQGFATMLRELLQREGVKERLAAERDGERRLTNLRHLMELLQGAVHDQGLGPAELLAWLGKRRRQAGGLGDEEQLRLESDRHLVRIVTVHKSKGLEYPVVFCPFLWEGSPVVRGRSLSPVSFHDPAGLVRMDLGSELLESHRLQQQTEALAEDLRLLYVALTRAKHRCYCCWGRVKSSREDVSATSPLGYLLHPHAGRADSGLIPALQGYFKDLDEEAVLAPLAELAARAGGAVAVQPLPIPAAVAGVAEEPRAVLVAPPRFGRKLAADWAIRSFSALSRGGESHGAVLDDEFSVRPVAGAGGAEVPPSIFSFPRGARAGTCLHAIFEELDFGDVHSPAARQLVRESLQRYGFAATWEEAVVGALADIVATPLDPAAPELRLDRISVTRRLNEMEFHYPLARVTPAGLQRVFGVHRGDLVIDDLPERLGGLVFSPGQGFMKGFVDLIFVWQGRYCIADYKSNHLGDGLACYGEPQLARAVAEAHYALQYHIYTVALHRHLKIRL